MTPIKDSTLIKIKTMNSKDLKQVDAASPGFLQGFVEVRGWVGIHVVLENTDTGAVRTENILDHVYRKNLGLNAAGAPEALTLFRERTPQLFLR